GYLNERFGIPESVFDDYLLFRRRRGWQMMRKCDATPRAAGLKIAKAGMRAFRKIGAFVKPSTRLIQSFGGLATRARIEIDHHELARLVDGGELLLDLDLDTGYVILELKGSGVLGLGFYINGRLRSQLPVKEIRRAMLTGPAGADRKEKTTA
ncbi:MAG: hypothetical protein DRH56_08560, partial [Deltaproteobacteria bacterium]